VRLRVFRKTLIVSFLVGDLISFNLCVLMRKTFRRVKELECEVYEGAITCRKHFKLS